MHGVYIHSYLVYNCYDVRHIWDLLLVEQVMTLGVLEMSFSSDGWSEWLGLDVLNWVELESMSGFVEGIKFACWSKHTNQSYFS